MVLLKPGQGCAEEEGNRVSKKQVGVGVKNGNDGAAATREPRGEQEGDSMDE